jgi:hypothetical protein
VRKLWLAGVPIAIVSVLCLYAGAGLIQSIAALAIVYGIGYATGSLLIDPAHDRTRLSLSVVRLIAGCLLTSIAFLLSLELSVPWFTGPLALFALAVIRHRRMAFCLPDVAITWSWDGAAAALVAVVLLAPPVIAALRMVPGTFPPVYFNVDVPYFLEQVHALVRADRFPPDSLSVAGGRRPYHFGLHALAAVIARSSGLAPHHFVFLILVPLLAAGILAAAVVLARAISPPVPSVLAIPLLLTPIPTLWYDFSQVLTQTVQDALAERSFDPFESLNMNWELWGVSPNIQNLAAHFLLLAGLGAVANASVMGWRLPAFLLGSAFVFKSPVGIAVVSGLAFAQACRAVMTRSLRPLIPFAAVAAVFAVVYAAFWLLSPVRGELRATVWPLFHLAYLDSHGGLRWFVYDVAWLLLPALVVVLAGRKDPGPTSLPLLAFALAPFIVVNVLRLEDLRRGFGISSMNEDDWRQVVMPIPVLLHAFVLSVVGRRWLHLGALCRSAVTIVIVAAVAPAVAAAARYATVLVEQPERGHEYADNRAIAGALAAIPVTDTILVTNDLRYPADGFSRENLQLQIPSLFGHQGFAVNSMYEAYPFSEERRQLQQLLEADTWTPAIDQAARIHRWTHLLIRKDYTHPSSIPLEQIFDSPLYSVYRFKKS